MMKRLVAIACGLLVLAAARGGEAEHHSHPVPEKLGTVNFATSCQPAVQGGFLRGLALLHSFSYTAAARAFEDVTERDPACAIAHWGVAMSHYHQLWEDPPAGEELRAAAEEARKAVAGRAGTEREREFCAAIATYYEGADRESTAARAVRYSNAMAEVARQNPADSEAQIFYALSLISIASPTDQTHAKQTQAAGILEPIFERQPNHPGLAHYLIHAYDSAALAPRGLAAARAYSAIAPSAPHALHMPSHVFTRLGYWDDSIASNRAARAAAHAEGDVGEELHAMDYMTYAYLQRGRYDEAAQIVREVAAMPNLATTGFKVGYAATAMPVRYAIERRDWAAAAALTPLPNLPPHVAALVSWARAVGKSRAGRPEAATADIEALEARLVETRAVAKPYWVAQVTALLGEARAWRLAATGDTEGALGELRRAADGEDAVEKLPTTPGPVVPAREQLGQLLLELKRPREALLEFKAALVLAPGRRGSLVGGIAAAEALGETQTVAELKATLGG